MRLKFIKINYPNLGWHRAYRITDEYGESCGVLTQGLRGGFWKIYLSDGRCLNYMRKSKSFLDAKQFARKYMEGKNGGNNL